jgi:hypothetical protein
MINTVIIVASIFFLGFLFSLLPATLIPSEVHTAVQAIGPKFADLIQLMPFIGTARTIFFIILTFEVSLMTIKALVWLFGKIRGVTS